jgi:hypothetical protein
MEKSVTCIENCLSPFATILIQLSLSDLTLDWLINYLQFYVPIKNLCLKWRRHHSGEELQYLGLYTTLSSPFSRLLWHTWRCRGYIFNPDLHRVILFVCFFFLITAWAFFQLSGVCQHYRWLSCKFMPMLSAQGLWAGGYLYGTTPTATQDLRLYGFIRKTSTNLQQWGSNPQLKDHQISNHCATRAPGWFWPLFDLRHLILNWNTKSWYKSWSGSFKCSDDDEKRLIDWLIDYCFTSRSIIFHLYGDVTIAGEGLQNLGLCSALMAFEQG